MDDLDEDDDNEFIDDPERCDVCQKRSFEYCGGCGKPLCPMCFEGGAGFCSACPDENYDPGEG